MNKFVIIDDNSWLMKKDQVIISSLLNNILIIYMTLIIETVEMWITQKFSIFLVKFMGDFSKYNNGKPFRIVDEQGEIIKSLIVTDDCVINIVYM